MKFGICTNMNSKSKNGVGAEHIAFYANCAFDYVELPLAQVMELDAATYTALRRELDKSRIPCLACNNFFPSSIKLTGPKHVKTDVQKYAKNAIAKANELGARVIVFGSSGARNVPPGFPMEEAMRQLTEVLMDVAPIAETYGILIAVEQHNPTEGNILNRFSDVRSLVKRIALPNVRCLFDNYHMEVVLETHNVLEGIGGDLAHIHLSGVLHNRDLPKNESELDYNGLFSRLKSEGYDSTISIEANASDLFCDTPAALSLVKQLWENS